MISITRDLARQLRSVLRKAGAGKSNRPTLQLESTGRELFVRAQLPLLTIECRVDSRQDTETLPLPVDALEEFNNKNTEQITFVRTKDGVEASWEDDRIPRRKCYDVPATAQLTVPTIDWSKGTVVPGLLEALANASQCVGDNHVRYDTQLTQLRGKAGEVIATDGHQALVQGGFAFPWQDDLLIPCAGLFSARELPTALPATVAKGKNHLGIQVFEWTIYLAIDSTSRFPDVAKAIAHDGNAATTLHLSPTDADFLSKTLSKLPGNDQESSPITIDLNGQVAIRAKEEGQPHPTEVLLTGSSVTGSPVCIQTDRRFLARAIGFDFAEFNVYGPDKPVICKNATRTFVWVPLPQAGVIPPSNDAIRIVSQENSTIPQSIKERMSPTMPTTNSDGRHQTNGESRANGDIQKTGEAQNTNGFLNGNGSANGSQADGDHASGDTAPGTVSLSSLIAEAQSLREYLHEGCVRASRLCSALKRHRKQSKLVTSTLASLRQLQQI